jgi:hypothetical protein
MTWSVGKRHLCIHMGTLRFDFSKRMFMSIGLFGFYTTGTGRKSWTTSIGTSRIIGLRICERFRIVRIAGTAKRKPPVQ